MKNQTKIRVQEVVVYVNGKQVFESLRLSEEMQAIRLATNMYRILAEQTGRAWRCKGSQALSGDRWHRLYWFDDLDGNRAILHVRFVVLK